MKIYQTQDIRNIALVGGAKSGKTSMAEAMAFCGGLINRRGSVDSKNTISDYRDIEHDRGYSVENTLMYTEFGGKKVNILDVPGFADYQGELDSALNVVEAAVVVVNAQSGVEVGTEIANRYAAKLDTPMLFVVNHLDAEKANFDDAVNQLKDFFGGKCTVLQFPTNAGLGFNQVVDIVANKMYTFTDGKYTEANIPAEYADKAEEMRMALVEEAAAADDALMEKYFENGDLTAEELTQALKLAIDKRDLFPILCTSAKENFGVNRLLEFICQNVPAPCEVADAKKTKGGKEPTFASTTVSSPKPRMWSTPATRARSASARCSSAAARTVSASRRLAPATSSAPSSSRMSRSTIPSPPPRTPTTPSARSSSRLLSTPSP